MRVIDGSLFSLNGPGVFKEQRRNWHICSGLPSVPYQFHITAHRPCARYLTFCFCAQEVQQLEYVTYKVQSESATRNLPSRRLLAASSIHLHQVSWDLVITPPSCIVTPKLSILSVSLQLQMIRRVVLRSSHPQAHLRVRPSPICCPVGFSTHRLLQLSGQLRSNRST